ncbi:hypothetical protein PTTG_05136 [Puccinia triticina 1-1 BBBD Race 1]|uniref:Transmembrane protein 14C n=1 Tax=Puccinia triticina (isolate 1-1 / race 1 (BBBD)) TaxID=630390 RepID=A0A180GC32_PUCT1|nr:hypothetical protein PTTG_05136 [Puccinia triticina 1-1 BBBD Race 1]
MFDAWDFSSPSGLLMGDENGPDDLILRLSQAPYRTDLHIFKTVSISLSDNDQRAGLPRPGGSAYGFLVATGGIMGFVKASSVPSLLAGTVSGGLIALGAHRYQQKGKPDLIFAMSVILALLMGNKFAASRKMMPAGITAVESARFRRSARPPNAGSCCSLRLFFCAVMVGLRAELVARHGRPIRAQNALEIAPLGLSPISPTRYQLKDARDPACFFLSLLPNLSAVVRPLSPFFFFENTRPDITEKPSATYITELRLGGPAAATDWPGSATRGGVGQAGPGKKKDRRFRCPSRGCPIGRS